MPALTSQALIQAILDAFQESDTPATFVSAQSKHPRRFILQAYDQSIEVWIYAWTLTHGGRPTLPDEFRIQMTTVSSPLSFNPGGLTLLLGYEPNINVFAGFDLTRHQTFAIGSPSVQIDIKCLHRALQDGIAFDKKNNNEIAIGVRPDQLFSYVVNAVDLHRLGKAPETFRLLTRASTLKAISPEEIAHLNEKRKRVVSTVTRVSRLANFRQQVMNAYGNRCAVTRMQLKLVEAAHILPVGVDGSIDDVRNGVALSPTFHRAYDSGLVYLGDDYVMRINPIKQIQLKTLNLHAGLQEFKQHLNKRIHLPSDQQQWPALKLIREANRIRKINLG